VLQDSLAIDELLGHEASSGKHGKTSVLKLLGGHDIVLLWVRRSEAKWVEANVTGTVVVTEETCLGDRDVLWVDPANFSTLSFSGTNDSQKDRPETCWNLREVSDGRSLDGGIEEEGGAFDLFADKLWMGREFC